MNSMLSFVIPCYRSENTIEKVVSELQRVLKNNPQYSYEIILVNDGSPDNTEKVLYQLVKKYPNLIYVNLSRNFGQHSALMAGFHQVKGDIVICLDDDGQTPPDECFKLIEKVQEGYDIAYAQYAKKEHSGFRNLGSRFNALCNHYFFNHPKELKVNSYFACKRFIVETAKQYPNPFPYVSGLLFQSVNNYCNVPITHRERDEGESGYTLKKLIKLWANGVTAFSIKPLRFASYAGWLTALLGLIYAIYIFIKKIFIPTMPMGWASTICLLLVLGGMIISLIGILGEYIGRIYLSINRSPQFVIREVVKSEEVKSEPSKDNS